MKIDQIPAKLKQFKHNYTKGEAFDFDDIMFTLWDWQSKCNPVFATFLKDINPNRNLDLLSPRFLPIAAFKNFNVQSYSFNAKEVFKSSGTTDMTRSSHYISDSSWVSVVNHRIFNECVANVTDSIFLALLPGYVERPDSSLIYMLKGFIQSSREPLSGFYLDQMDTLIQILESSQIQKKIFLFAVPWFLFELNRQFPNLKMRKVTIVETGGMKGRGPEMPKNILHHELSKMFEPLAIFSEYGMTELTSQAYAISKGRFTVPSTMKILITEVNDPFEICKPGQSGNICIIDLANIDSCAFIRTDDLGKINDDGTFEVIGRIDHADLRGCNLLAG